MGGKNRKEEGLNDLLKVIPVLCLADHSIMRTVRQGLLAEIKVSGKSEPDIFESLPS